MGRWGIVAVYAVCAVAELDPCAGRDDLSARCCEGLDTLVHDGYIPSGYKLRDCAIEVPRSNEEDFTSSFYPNGFGCTFVGCFGSVVSLVD